ncbi:MAG: YabP/YqfC family sporulation protein [Oscillospiraceae bacterium]|nr:YabP/YqfC family sporulation protein [Oscillospiraceae bacterium]
MGKAVCRLDLPAETAGLPRIELLGDRELRVEYHKGILAYGPEEIHISGGKLLLRVRGSGLELKGMNPTELCIAGHIRAVELE